MNPDEQNEVIEAWQTSAPYWDIVPRTYHPDVRAHWLDFSAASRDEPDNQGARDRYHSGDDYSPEKRARHEERFFQYALALGWRWREANGL